MGASGGTVADEAHVYREWGQVFEAWKRDAAGKA